MMKERAVAIFIGLIMIFSIGGFALSSIVVRTDDQPQYPQIPVIIDRPLTQEEKIFVLRTGRAIIEDFYEEECIECVERGGFLESFVTRFQQYLVLSRTALTNDTSNVKFQIIGSGGAIKNLDNAELTEENFFNILCDMAVVQPKECILMDI